MVPDDLSLYQLAPAAIGGSPLPYVQRLIAGAPKELRGPGQWLTRLSLVVLPDLTMALAGTVHDTTPLLDTHRSEPVTVAEMTEEGFSDAPACENSGPWVLVLSGLGFFSGNLDAAPGCTHQNPSIWPTWDVERRPTPTIGTLRAAH